MPYLYEAKDRQREIEQEDELGTQEELDAQDAQDRVDAQGVTFDPETLEQVTEDRDAALLASDDPAVLASAVGSSVTPAGELVSFHTTRASAVRHDSLKHRVALDQISARDRWHLVGTPEAVSEAWEAVQGAVAEAREAGAAAVAAAGGRKQAERERAGKIADAVVAGRSIPKPAAVADEATLAAVAAGKLRIAKGARATYDGIVLEVKGEWLAELEDKLPEALTSGLEAVAEALRVVESMSAAIGAVQGGAPAGHTSRRVPEVGEALQSLQGAQESLSAVDLSVALTHPAPKVDLAERRALVNSGDLRAMRMVAELEAEDRKAGVFVSDLMAGRPYAHLPGRNA